MFSGSPPDPGGEGFSPFSEGGRGASSFFKIKTQILRHCVPQNDKTYLSVVLNGT